MIIKRYIPAKLSGLVDLIWEQYADQPAKWKILPSGKVEIIFKMGAPAKMHNAKKLNDLNSPLNNFCFLSGLHTRPLALEYEHFHYFGIQMKPIAVKAFFDIPLYLFRDYYVEGVTLFNTLNEIEDKLLSFESFNERAIWMENFLYNRIIETPELHHIINLYSTAENVIRKRIHGQNCSIEQHLGYSRTQTFRIFNDWFGLSSHAFQRLLQFVQSIHHLHSLPDNLTMTGLKAGYFDQAHFIHSFKSFSDMTPGQYQSNKSHIPGQLPF